jgi:DNA (cytosine-5)-methyltransferase 1
MGEGLRCGSHYDDCRDDEGSRADRQADARCVDRFLSGYSDTVSHVGTEFSIVGLFAGVGGLECGLVGAGGRAELLCEWWDPARSVLKAHWPEVPLHGDVQTLEAIPRVDVVTAGFPCQDLSQAGRMAGITGKRSGLVGEIFRLIEKSHPRWLVLENVRNMLVLDQGRAMRFLIDSLESLGYRWAYRLVDSRSSGVPQRRQRVLLVASRTEDPSTVLFADEAGEPKLDTLAEDAFGFYWTEGLTGLGWARDAVPTLKGGSTLGIPSPPAIWIPGAPVGRQVVTPLIEDAEALQGFPRGWTEHAQPNGKRNGPRWKLVGNAVSVGVSQWLGMRLANPGEPNREGRIFDKKKWPTAAWGGNGKAWASPMSMWPVSQAYTHLLDIVDASTAVPLSLRATAGFLSRTERSTLRFDADFLVSLKEHVRMRTAEQELVG